MKNETCQICAVAVCNNSPQKPKLLTIREHVIHHRVLKDMKNIKGQIFCRILKPFGFITEDDTINLIWINLAVQFTSLP